jgi:hypothetical protein
MTDAVYNIPEDLHWMDAPSRRVYKYLLNIKLSRGELQSDQQRSRLCLLAVDLVLAEQLTTLTEPVMNELTTSGLQRQFKQLQILCRDLKAFGFDQTDLTGLNMAHPRGLLYTTHYQLQNRPDE